MTYVYAVLSLLGGLGVFLIGMHSLSDNMTKLTNGRLQTLLNKTSKSKVFGVGIGMVVTMIAQSSSLTTVMVVGLVNAGIVTLFQATTIIMGANIGTTITAQIVALQSFSFSKFAVVLALIGIFMVMFSKSEKVKSAGKAIYGLGLIFIGLELMSSSMSIFRESEGIMHLFSSISNPFLLLLIGIAVTALVQSSSAVTSILITMTTAGIAVGNGGNSVLYVILGTNIGTCVTALLSSIGTNANAKRASLIHLIFNTFGTVLFMILLLCWRGFMDTTFAKWFEYPGTQIAMFHTFFNVICVAIMLPMTKLFVKVATLLIHDKKVPEVKLIDFDQRLLKSPGLALGQLVKQTCKMFDDSVVALKGAFDGFVAKDQASIEIVVEENVKLSKISREITDYLVRLSAEDVSLSEEKIISALHYTINDIVRIGELADNITKYTKHYIEDNLVFSEEVILLLKNMFEKIFSLYNYTRETFLNMDYKTLKTIDELEEKIDSDRKALIDNHIKRLNEGKCQPQNSGVFINLVSNLERSADHMTYVAHSIDSMR